MRVLACILSLSALAAIGSGQDSPASPAEESSVRVHQLSLTETSSMPYKERAQIVQVFEGKTYLEGEIAERVRIAFQNLGYFTAQVADVKVSPVAESQTATDVDVSIRVNQGVQYRLGKLRFENASTFPPDRMRKLFGVQNGDLFNYSKIGKGLDKLRELYANDGYVNFVGAPNMSFDNLRRTIDLTVLIDEGKPFDFGRLVFNGTEPYAGAGNKLLGSWVELEGNRYNLPQLERWLRAKTSNWPTPLTADQIIIRQDPELHVVDVQLQLR